MTIDSRQHSERTYINFRGSADSSARRVKDSIDIPIAEAEVGYQGWHIAKFYPKVTPN